MLHGIKRRFVLTSKEITTARDICSMIRNISRTSSRVKIIKKTNETGERKREERKKERRHLKLIICVSSAHIFI